MMEDFFWLAIENFRKRKLRSWLTMVSIFIGIAAVVALSSLGLGLQSFVDEQFSVLGADKLFVQPKTGFGLPGSDTSTAELTKDDIDIVKRTRGITEATSFHLSLICILL